MSAQQLTEEDRRLPYFYSHFDGVKCPDCAESILERAPDEAKNIQAHYFTDRLLRCDGCFVFIGPLAHEAVEV
jgi:hypothetical protein